MVLLSLGSNLGDRKQMLTNAIILVGEIIGKVAAISNLYETEPDGFRSPNDFLNIAIAVETALPPEEVLARTQAIERELGRKPRTSADYEDRPIDIDILFYDNLIINSEQLTIPHPQVHARAFVLDPLAEIAPGFVHPVLGKTVEELCSITRHCGLAPQSAILFGDSVSSTG